MGKENNRGTESLSRSLEEVVVAKDASHQSSNEHDADPHEVEVRKSPLLRYTRKTHIYLPGRIVDEGQY